MYAPGVVEGRHCVDSRRDSDVQVRDLNMSEMGECWGVGTWGKKGVQRASCRHVHGTQGGGHALTRQAAPHGNARDQRHQHAVSGMGDM